nr:hypothetical protein [Histidinibacterium aquaticum]
MLGAILLTATGWRMPDTAESPGLVAAALLWPVLAGLALGAAIGLYRWRKAGQELPHDDIT